MPSNKVVSYRITQWFRNTSPWIHRIVSIFLNNCDKYHLQICMAEPKFYDVMSEALCVMYHASKTNTDWSGPNRQFPSPSDWNDTKEQLWNDYLHGRVFTFDFWDSFWNSVSEESWECGIPNLRVNFQYLLPLYVQRSNETLIQDGSLVEQEDGQIVSVEDCETSEDTWFY